MLLIERLLKDKTLTTEMQESLSDAVVILVDNVSDFYFKESSQEVWNLFDDFPNCAPPWPTAFFEWGFPKTINSDGKVNPCHLHGYKAGMLVQSKRFGEVDLKNLPAELRMKHVQEYYRAMVLNKILELPDGELKEQMYMEYNSDPEYIWRNLPSKNKKQAMDSFDHIADIKANEDIQWVCTCIFFLHPPYAQPQPIAHYSFPLDSQGQFRQTKDGQVEAAFGPWDSQADLETIQNVTALGLTWLHVPMLATSFTHCKNVNVVAQEPHKHIARRFLRRHGIPKVTHHILEIDPMKTTLRSEGGMDEHGSSQRALHICRGHFKDYRERGLFGRVHGLFWWDAHVRGSTEHGVRTKDYRVKSGR